MIEKNSIEWELWKDAYNLRSELTPPPRYSESDNYWGQALEKIREGYNKYKDTNLKALAQEIYFGILQQLEDESKAQEKIESIVNSVAEGLKIGF